MRRLMRIQILYLTQILCLLWVGIASAQTAAVDGFWNWTKSEEHHNAVVQVTTDTGAGSGVLVHVFRTRPIRGGYEGLVLTAHHVVSDGAEIKISYPNGKKAKKCSILCVNEATDIAFLRVWVPDDVKDCLLYTSPSPRDQRGSRMPSSA